MTAAIMAGVAGTMAIDPSLRGTDRNEDHWCIASITGPQTMCRGNNDQGQLGLGYKDLAVHDWEQVIGGHQFKTITINGKSTTGLTTNGHIFVWGNDIDAPTEVPFPSNVNTAMNVSDGGLTKCFTTTVRSTR